ncbi:MAG: ChbG/HpnK family deacetylase [Alphaproteobacteria bacterium]|nr:ChbG/HpnK family deacetylase [Alphaproteobacteria bacterium]
MRSLIVTADDFGAAVEINEAVELGHREGLLTAASLMVAGEAAADAVERARRLPGLGVGLHLVLVEGRPVLAPEALPDLVGPDGCFRTDMAWMGLDIFLKPHVRRQVEREIEAQFAAFAATGLPLDHVNAHKHYHLHPTVLKLVLRIGGRFGMTAVRAPVEPREVLGRVEPGGRAAGAGIAGPWAKRVHRHCTRAGLAVPDQVFGVAWSGAMTAARVKGLIEHLPDGLSEIYLHPATSDAYRGHVPGYVCRAELEALLDPAVRVAARHSAALGCFRDFPASERKAAAPSAGEFR